MSKRVEAYQKLEEGLRPALGAAAFMFARQIAAEEPSEWIERYETALRAVRNYVAAVGEIRSP